jgi:outer membrane protein OmpA-like peptidoglycan-associated protein
VLIKEQLMLRKISALLFLFLCFGSAALAGSDTFSVFFRTNDSKLSQGMERRLDDAIYKGAISDKDAIWLIGYADEVGGVEENLRLSRARAKRVKSYLVRSGFRPERITLLEGKGKEGAHEIFFGEGYPRDRRVDIVRAALPPAPEPVVEVVKPTPPPVVEKAKSVPPPPPIDVSKVAVGESIKLDNIYFVGGSHRFMPNSLPTLDDLYESLKDHPNVRIKIEGHICCFPNNQGDGMDFDTNTPELSLNRARAVRDYLIGKGIAAERMQVEGFGRRKPIYNIEQTEEQMQANRRVEIRILQ